MMIDSSADMAGFFRERLVTALGRQRARVGADIEVYLLNLLTTFVHSPSGGVLGTTLVERLAAALHAPDRPERFRRYRELGDCALYACGFFSDHLDRRGISRDYVVGMGARAYAAAADLAGRSWVARSAPRGVYPELADGFDTFACVLADVRETTALQTPQDIIRLYERWRRTHSPVLAERLEQEGVFPQMVMPAGVTLH